MARLRRETISLMIDRDTKTDEIARLKAELEKNSEIIQCEKCMNWKNINFTKYGVKYGDCDGIDNPGTNLQLRTFCDMSCSRGQRRESEEK